MKEGSTVNVEVDNKRRQFKLSAERRTREEREKEYTFRARTKNALEPRDKFSFSYQFYSLIFNSRENSFCLSFSLSYFSDEKASLFFYTRQGNLVSDPHPPSKKKGSFFFGSFTSSCCKLLDNSVEFSRDLPLKFIDLQAAFTLNLSTCPAHHSLKSLFYTYTCEIKAMKRMLLLYIIIATKKNSLLWFSWKAAMKVQQREWLSGWIQTSKTQTA